MILTGSEDIRVKKTILSIRNAFCKLICEMDYERITVKELCARAMINKKTFYTYYDTLDYLLFEVQESYSAPFIAEVGTYKLPNDIGRLIRQFFEFSARQDEAYEKITCSSSYQSIRNKMIDTVMIQSSGSKLPIIFPQLNDFQNNLIYHFWHETVLMVYKSWIEDQKKTSLEDIINFANGLVLKGLENFVSPTKPTGLYPYPANNLSGKK